MQTYITLIKYTQQGLQNIKDAPQRLAAAKAAIEAAGGKWIAYYLTLGQYDGVLISEGPDPKMVAGVSLAIGAQGNLHTQTLVAFTQDETLEIVGKLP